MYVAIVTVFYEHYTDNVGLTVHYVLITCSIIIQDTKQKISKLLAAEEEKRKQQQHQSNEDTVDKTQGNYAVLISLYYIAMYIYLVLSY